MTLVLASCTAKLEPNERSPDAATAELVSSCTETAIRADAPAAAKTYLDRAFDWVHRGIMYSHSPNPACDGYRTDCSGFVSWIWNLGAPGLTTYQFAGGVWDKHVSYVLGSYNDLQVGDALNFPGNPSIGTGHIAFFAGWLNTAHTSYCVIQENATGTPANVARWGIDTSYLPIRVNGYNPYPVVGSDGCTDAERSAFAAYACQCVNHQGSGGFCPGTGCTSTETANCAAYAAQCVDHQCSGGFGTGHGCTAREEIDCGNTGCDCVDHQCSGGSCAGSGCTAREQIDCANDGYQCTHHCTKYDVKTGDFDGDGKTDVLTWSPNAGATFTSSAALELSTGAGFSSAQWGLATATHARNGGSGQSYRTFTGDFDGNGKTDLATISPNGGGGWATNAYMELSSGTGFWGQPWGAGTPVHMRNGGSSSLYTTVTGDFDGNGKTDLATISPNGGGGWGTTVYLELSSGSGFGWAAWPANTPIHMRNGGSTNSYITLAGDFDGNGKTDLATISPNGGGGWGTTVYMELSVGNGFASAAWPAHTPIHMRNGGSSASYTVIAADLNGDGKTDLATISKNSGGGWASIVYVELSAGNGFASAAWPASTPVHMRNGDSSRSYRTLAADVNADGKADLITLSPNGGGGWADWMAVEISSGTSFRSIVWSTPTPQHMRNGGSERDYRVLTGRFDPGLAMDVAVISTDGGGAWSDWLTVDRGVSAPWSTVTLGSTRPEWSAATPRLMRNAMR